MESVLIAFMCSQLLLIAPGPQTQPACSSAATAASIKTGLRGDLNFVQSKGDKMLHDEFLDKINMNAQKGAMVLFTGYGFMTSQSAQFSTSFKPISDSLSISGNRQSGVATLTWAF